VVVGAVVVTGGAESDLTVGAAPPEQPAQTTAVTTTATSVHGPGRITRPPYSGMRPSGQSTSRTVIRQIAIRHISRPNPTRNPAWPTSAQP